MKRPIVKPRIRVIEPVAGGLMVSVYQAKRPGEVGHVGFIGPLTGSRPGGSVMR